MTALAKRAVDKFATFNRDTGETLRFHRAGRAQDRAHRSACRPARARSRARPAPGDRRRAIRLARRGASAASLAGNLGHRRSELRADRLHTSSSRRSRASTRAPPSASAPRCCRTRCDRRRTAPRAVAGVEYRARRRSAARPSSTPQGAWLRAGRRLAGANVPMMAMRHQLLITEPIAGVEPLQPITRIIDANVYVRPNGGGLMLGGYEPDPLQYDAGALPSRFRHRRPPARFFSDAAPGGPSARAISRLPACAAGNRVAECIAAVCRP